MSSPAQARGTGDSNDGGLRGHRSQRGAKAKKNKSATAERRPSTSRVKDDVYLVVSLCTTGRTPLNGWVLSLGAVAIAAQTRRVLGTFSRNFLPLLPETNIAPAADVVGYLRRQRAELELCYRLGTRVPVEEGMRDLQAFCEPFANLTLVASPLFSVYGWLSYYWTHTFPSSKQSPAPPMPWGFSGVCAKSHASGRLGIPVKKLTADAAYQASFEGYRGVGVPLADALAAAVSFTHLSWPSAQVREGGAAEGLARPPVSFACELPALLGEVGCVPATAPAAVAGAIRWSSALPGSLTGAATPGRSDEGDHPANTEAGASADATAAAATSTTTFPTPRPILECVVDKASVLDGLALRESEEDATAQAFREYPSITDCVHHTEFLAQLPAALVKDDVEWVATEKVHGSHITIFSDGTRLWAAKRTGYLHLRDSSSFFEFVFIMEEWRPALLKGYQLVTEWLGDKANLPRRRGRGAEDATVIVAFMCELAGGVYPHPNVPVDIRGGRVQNGVYYSPQNFLYGFDIAVEWPHDGAGCDALCPTSAGGVDGAAFGGGVSLMGKDGRFYLPFDDALRIFKQAGFSAYARALHRGPLSALLQLPVEFPSTVATEQLGLPAITARKNEAEGYVIRPVHDAWVRLPAMGAGHQRAQGSSDSAVEGCREADTAWARVILKRKHPCFDEFAARNSATSLQEQQERARAAGCAAGAPEEGERLSAAVDLTAFLTAGRVESVLSKYTEAERGDHARMVSAVLADALRDARMFSPQRNPA